MTEYVGGVLAIAVSVVLVSLVVAVAFAVLDVVLHLPMVVIAAGAWAGWALWRRAKEAG